MRSFEGREEIVGRGSIYYDVSEEIDVFFIVRVGYYVFIINGEECDGDELYGI